MNSQGTSETVGILASQSDLSSGTDDDAGLSCISIDNARITSIIREP